MGNHIIQLLRAGIPEASLCSQADVNRFVDRDLASWPARVIAALRSVPIRYQSLPWDLEHVWHAPASGESSTDAS